VIGQAHDDLTAGQEDTDCRNAPAEGHSCPPRPRDLPGGQPRRKDGGGQDRQQSPAPRTRAIPKGRPGSRN
jgi:hypothetical protein